MEEKLEEMGSFFDERVDFYDEHMMKDVDKGSGYYIETAKYIPKIDGLKLLDLGCGTGLEISEILKVNKKIQFTGIDLSTKMLEKFKGKFKDKIENINLINASYLDVDYGKGVYDAVVSVETMHHFTHEEKLKIYKKIYESLKLGGRYVETDYIAEDQEAEEHFYSEFNRIKAEMHLSKGFYHYDTPCTAENIIMLMKKAGFSEVQLKWKNGTTAIITADK